MKRNVISVVILAVAVCLAVSCKKDVAQQSSEFTGVIEQLESDSKTTLNSSDIVEWENTDQVAINGSTFTASPLSPASSAMFTGGSSVSAPYTAWYPASIKDGILPSVQTYTEDHIRNLPMYGYSESSSDIKFHNICGVIELNLTDEYAKSVRQIVVTSAENNLSGTFTISGDGTASNIYRASVSSLSGNHSVILDCGEGVALSSTAKKFWIAIPQGNHTLKFRIIATDNTYYEVTTNGQKEVKANHIYPITWDMSSKFGTTKASGPFLVSSNRVIYFALGNLKKNGLTYELYTNQYDNDKSASLDQFPWNATTYNDLLGFDIIPTEGDWAYATYTNTRVGSNVDGVANRRFVKCKKAGKRGCLIFPDGASITGISSGYNWNSTTNSYKTITNVADWQKFEAAGCVFIPETGYRTSASSGNADETCAYYWSSTLSTEHPLDVTGVYIFCGNGGPQKSTENSGNANFHISIRLIQVR